MATQAPRSGDNSQPLQRKQSPPKSKVSPHPLVVEQAAKDVWLLLVVIRCINALCVKTFFQPDEYYQSLEPAWQLAFGQDSGAWITWEWQHGLRSSLHPVLFAAVYFILDNGMRLVQCYPQFRAEILSVAPNLVQAIFAAAGDYYTWKLAQRVYGLGSNQAWTVLIMTICSPWQWFCSTRTFSNSLETTLTVAALYYWPWQYIKSSNISPTDIDPQGRTDPDKQPMSLRSLRTALLLAGFACILRPTNILLWIPVISPVLMHLASDGPRYMGLGADAGKAQSQQAQTRWSSLNLQTERMLLILREAMICGSMVLLLAALSDRSYFGRFIFPPYEWLRYNITQDLAVFYGRNDWHYYVSQGLPLLMTTYLPFLAIGLYRGSFLDIMAPWKFLHLPTVILFTVISTLSLISHKEVRFIYPLLPLMHIISAPHVWSFFTTAHSVAEHSGKRVTDPASPVYRRKSLMIVMASLNISIAYYVTRIHQSGVIPVTGFLRREYATLALDYRGRSLSPLMESSALLDKASTSPFDNSQVFAGFLMPCHSVPWRSQLYYSNLKAWALTCEPPLHLTTAAARSTYRDEADRFYDDPMHFLSTEINTPDRPWPRYIVGFAGIEDVLRKWYETAGTQYMQGWRMRERWRTRNSQWHDDERRKGDVVVWEFVDGSRVP